VGIAQEGAAQTRELSLEELSEKSEVIVTGKVVDKRSEWNQEKTRIYTHVTVAVDDYHKGEGSEQTVTVVHLGGEVGDVGELYTSVAKFEKDEEVVLFLRKDRRGNLRVTGSDRGKYCIKRDDRTGVKRIEKFGTLDSFKAHIKNIVEKQKLE
jgi:hypothetical protein